MFHLDSRLYQSNIIDLKLGIETSKVTGNPHTGTAAQAANPGDLRAKVFGKPLAQIPKAKASSSHAFYQDGSGWLPHIVTNKTNYKLIMIQY